MRLVLDVQSLQSDSRLRGIGRYTRSVIAELAAANPELEITLLLNGSYGDDPHTLLGELATLSGGTSDTCNTSATVHTTSDAALSNEGAFVGADHAASTHVRIGDAVLECVQCYLPAPTGAYDPANRIRESLAELLREAFINELEPDLVHVFSVMEGYADNVVTSIGRLPADYPVTATFYDLIPLLNPEEYLHRNAAFARHYESKLESLRRAGGLLAISHFSGSEAAQYLEYPAEKISVAPLGPLSSDQHHREASDASAESILAALDLTSGFLLYVGGADARKNLPRLVEAWAALPGHLQVAHPLVLAGSMPEQDVMALGAIARTASACPENLRFLGQISDQTLTALYDACSAFVFPSWHEGFGLPALEAMAAGAAVIAADASSLPEVVDLPEALFDPHDVTDIAAHLERVLTDDAFRQRLRAHGPQQAAKFSWQRTAQDTLDFFAKAVDAAEMARKTHAGESSADGSHAEATWQQRYASRLKALTVRLASELALVADARQRNELMSECAAALERNEQLLMQRDFRRRSAISPWLIEGPFDSSYSLALLNRELARALRGAGVEVSLHSTEGPGDFNPDPTFMAQNHDLVEITLAGGAPLPAAAVSSRLLYPPRVNDMPPGLNLLHLYGWEEGELPAHWVADFNRHLHGITTMSQFVSKVLIDNGVVVPQSVAGVGVDHWERIEEDVDFLLPSPRAAFTFLHVSSCFPRKGVDVLLTAWGEAFSSEDDVTLVIKTFPNPHNSVRESLQAARDANPKYPAVVLLENDLTDGEMKALMGGCDVLVAPSRGEGFGLPVAEAMLSGVAVIVTGYGGHMDFCDRDNAWLVDYSFARAETHFELSNSIWVEPNKADLVRQLRAVYSASSGERKERAERGRARLLAEFRWAQTAERVTLAAKRWNSLPSCTEEATPLRVGWVSSWNTRCGIASYSGYLVSHSRLDVKVFAARRKPEEELDKWLLPADGPEVARCWTSGDGDDLLELQTAILADLPSAVVVQFNYGLYSFSALASLISFLKQVGVTVIVTLHTTADPPHLPDRRLEYLSQVLEECDRLLVHTPQDLNRLKALGLTQNTALLPHGVIDGAQSAYRDQRVGSSVEEPFRIASFGFLLPHKGLEQLIKAVELLRHQGRSITLNMLNAEYPAEVSRNAKRVIQNQLAAADLDGLVTLDTTYYTDAECLERLGEADLIVFPYQNTLESSSAAVRHAIGSGVPVAVTPLDIFEDVEGAVIKLPGAEPEALAEGIRDAMNWTEARWRAERDRSDVWCRNHSHEVVSRKLDGMIRALVNAK